MKKLPIVLLAILMVFSLFSCAEPEVAPPKEYTVSFEGITKDPVKVKEGEKFILPAVMPSMEGYKLIVKMGETVLEAGKKYEITADTVLKCSWEKIAPEGNPNIKRTISFDIKDKYGNAIARDPETVNDGAEFTVPEDIRNGIEVPDGSAFVIRNNGKQLYPGNKITVTSDITINCAILPGSDDLNIVEGVVQAKTSGYYTDSIVIPEKTKDGNPVTGISEGAFFDCTSLTPITIPDSVTSIGEYAFENCTSLTSITIPDSVTSIGEGAFYHAGLTEIHIPAKAKFAEYNGKYDNPFVSCSKLKTITVDINNETLKSQDNCILSKDGKTLITCTSDAEIPAGVTEIGASACYGMDFSSGTIIIPDGVTSIGGWAFSYCYNLTSITIPNSVTSIGESAFRYCVDLTSITIPKSVTIIGEEAFKGCSKLITINVSKPESACTSWGTKWHGATATHKVTVQYTDKTVVYPTP